WRGDAIERGARGVLPAAQRLLHRQALKQRALEEESPQRGEGELEPCAGGEAERLGEHRLPSGAEVGPLGLEDGAVERLLAAEVVIDHPRVRRGALADDVDPGAGEAVLGELLGGGEKERGARVEVRPHEVNIYLLRPSAQVRA